jgi:nucleoid-associated protein YgaU
LIIPEAPAGATPATVKPAGKDGAEVKAGNKPETADGKAGTKSVADAKPGTKVSPDAKPGTKLSADAKPAEPPVKAESKQSKEAVVPPADPSRSYTVQPGEGWYDLARKFMGDGKNYPELYEYNKERVGGDPHLLRAGTVIELPPKAKLPAKTASPSSRPAK